jgi:hypothetical protein
MKPVYESNSDDLDIAFAYVEGFVAQIGLRSDLPLPETDSAYWRGTGYAESCEVV